MPNDEEKDSTKQHRIGETELSELERVLPDLMWEMAFMKMPMVEQAGMTPRQKTQWRRVMQIVTSIRWQGGPPMEVDIIPAEPE